MKAQTAVRIDREDLLRAARAMIVNHGHAAAAVAAARAGNLTAPDAKDARRTWEQVAQTINRIQESPHWVN